MKNIFLILIITIAVVSCKKDDNDKVISGSNTLIGANVVPAVTTTGTAKFDYAYNPNIRTFVYTVNYSGLSDSCVQFGIARANAGQPLPSSIYQLFNFTTAISLQKRTTGTYSGNFVVDGQSITIDDLRSGKFCVYLRRRNPASPTSGSAGFEEVRGQIAF